MSETGVERLSANHDLVQLTLELAGSLDARTVIRRILERGVAMASADRATLSSFRDGRLTIEATVGSGGLVTWVGHEYPLETMLRQPLVAEMLAGRHTVLGGPLAVQSAEPEFRDALGRVRHTAVVPILERGDIAGLLVLSRHREPGFAEPDVPVLNGFGALAGLALRNATLYEEAMATSRRLRAAAQAATDLAAHDTLEALVQRLIEHACAAAGADSAAIMHVEDNVGIIEATSGTAPLGSRWPLSDDITAAIAAGHVHQVATAESTSRLAGELRDHASPYGHALVAPLRFAGDLLGLLVLGRHAGRGAFSDADVAALQQFAGLAAVILHNGRLVHELRAAEASKREFMSLVVHELRGPLTVIEGYTDMLISGGAASGTDLEAQLGTIRRQADHARGLVDDLLVLARIESGALGVARQVLSVAEVLADAVDRVRPAAELRSGTVRIESAPALSAVGDGTLVARVLDNLLRNAVVYSRDEPAVAVSASADAEAVRIRVLDRGPGVPSDEREQIFARFGRGSRAGRIRGNGIGLYVSRECARRMGGDLILESSADTGSCFLLTLPLAATG